MKIIAHDWTEYGQYNGEPLIFNGWAVIDEAGMIVERFDTYAQAENWIRLND